VCVCVCVCVCVRERERERECVFERKSVSVCFVCVRVYVCARKHCDVTPCIGSCH